MTKTFTIEVSDVSTASAAVNPLTVTVPEVHTAAYFTVVVTVPPLTTYPTYALLVVVTPVIDSALVPATSVV